MEGNALVLYAEHQQQNGNFMQQNLRDLLDQTLPAQIAQLEESSVSLERVAAFCEANYLQSPNKNAALAETKRFALQSLASVAYFVGDLSRSLLQSLELESMNLATKTAEIKNINQLIAIQKEKAARREIGKLTVNKNVIRQNKITFPAAEERTPRYHRTPIDFSILDGVGHGQRSAPISDYVVVGHPYGTYGTTMGHNRAGSTASAESGKSGMPPIYDHYARANYVTLSRGSVRSTAALHDQYRVPQPIPSTVPVHHQMSSERSSLPYAQYVENQQRSDQHASNAIYPQQQQQQRYTTNSNSSLPPQIAAATTSTTMRVNGMGESISNLNGHYQQQQMNSGQQQPYGTITRMTHPVTVATNGSTTTDGHLYAAGGPMNNSADFSDDSLPLPPPLLLTNPDVPNIHQNPFEQNQQEQDDGFPPPPSLHPNPIGSQMLPDWVPQQYIEKAIVLYDYDSRNSDELHLYQGALVYVLRKNEDGWFEGVMDGVTGLFPGNYVQSIQ